MTSHTSDLSKVVSLEPPKESTDVEPTTLEYDTDLENAQIKLPKYSPIGSRRERSGSTKKSMKDAISVIQEEDALSVSVGSVSSTSQFSIKEGNLFRPPPGLAPPPGFANTDMLQIPKQSSKLHLNTQVSSAEVATIPTPQDKTLLSNFVVGDEFSLTEKNTGHNVIQEDAAYINNSNENETLLSGLNQDFNVMNFLSFLDEGVDAEGDNSQSLEEEDVYTPMLNVSTKSVVQAKLSFLDEGADAEGGTSQTRQEDDVYTPMLYNVPTKSVVQANPWSESSKPRALAYGIEVEQEGSKDESDNGFELLPKSMIFGSSHEATDDLGVEKDLGEDNLLNIAGLLDD
jgi:hypothetical protein